MNIQTTKKANRFVCAQINGLCGSSTVVTGGSNGGTSCATTPNSVNSSMPSSLQERGMSITSAGSPSKKTGTGSSSTITGAPDTVRKSRSQGMVELFEHTFNFICFVSTRKKVIFFFLQY